MNLSELKPGQRAVVVDFTDAELALKLMEMGCTPGEELTLKYIAPLGDPIAVSISGYLLSLRKKEASTIIINLLP